MKIILTSIGTRGDMEPFLAIGQILREHGHHVICAFPEQFRSLAEDSGFDFYSLGSKFLDLLNSPDGKIAMSGGKFGFRKIKAYIKLFANQSEANKELTQAQETIIEAQKPDRIVHHPKAVYPVIWSIKNKGKTTLISPVPYLHYVKNHSHLIFNKNFGTFLNKVSYQIINFALIKNVQYCKKWLSYSGKLKYTEIKKSMRSSNVIYTISPSLFKRPNYWNDKLKVLGFHERDKTTNWNPSEKLESFLQQHKKIVFITFGSMVNSNPKQKTDLILNIFEKNKIPAIINTCSGGLIKPENYNTDLIYFTESIPYEWIFPKMYAVIHHGGSGTTHMALKYKCPNLIIPHIIDQYIWNKLVFENGIGPLGLDISKVNANNLEIKVIDLLENINYKKKAIELGNKMDAENYTMDILHSIV